MKKNKDLTQVSPANAWDDVITYPAEGETIKTAFQYLKAYMYRAIKTSQNSEMDDLFYRSVKYAIEFMHEEEKAELEPLVESLIAACVARREKEAREQETYKQIEDEE